MAAVDDAGDAVAFGLGDLGRHQVDVMHDVRARRAAASAATSGERRQTIGGPGSGRGCGEFRVEIGSQLHVLVETAWRRPPTLRARSL